MPAKGVALALDEDAAVDQDLDAEARLEFGESEGRDRPVRSVITRDAWPPRQCGVAIALLGRWLS
jgi:hypothetical protein